jgi:hypothetical protein
MPKEQRPENSISVLIVSSTTLETLTMQDWIVKPSHGRELRQDLPGRITSTGRLMNPANNVREGGCSPRSSGTVQPGLVRSSPRLQRRAVVWELR